jgi:3D (Asp-Asp-Asp) domain-containing protein
MINRRNNILKLAVKKIAVLMLISISAIASFATLGDGNKKNSNRSLLSGKSTSYKQGYFSLRSGYTFRGSQVLNNASPKKYISINTTVSIQRGNSTVIVPLKKTVVVAGTGGVKFNLGRR